MAKVMAKAGLIAMVLMIGLVGILVGEAEAQAENGPVGGGHPYYTTEEMEANHANMVKSMKVSILEADGEMWTYKMNKKTNGKFKAQEKDIEGVAGSYTNEELNQMHDNTVQVIIQVIEEDGDAFLYTADAETNGYYLMIASGAGIPAPA